MAYRMDLCFWHAHAFAKCDFKKGAAFVEPKRDPCLKQAVRLPESSARVCDNARNASLAHSYGSQVKCPYATGTMAQRVWSSVANEAVQEDRSPY